MIVRTPLRGFATAGILALSLAACQGNIGSGSGLSIPAAPAPYQPGGPAAQTQSRERALEGAVYMSAASPLPDLPLPSVGGFGIDINLGTPAPLPTPTPVSSATPKSSKSLKSKRAKTSAVGHRAYVLALNAEAASSPAAAASGSAAPSAAASSLPSAASSAAPVPAGVTHLSDASPSASGSPGVTASGSPAAAGSAKPNHHTHASINSGPKIETKTVAYPDDAPAPPTPEPTGNIQTFPARKPLVRGYLKPAVDVPIYGLGAIRFFVPKDELTMTRGYTIAVFTYAKKHKGKLLEYDTAPTVLTDSVTSSFADDPIVFKKTIAYEIVLYADQGAATPVPVPSGYPAAGANPFYTPVPSGYTPAPGQAPGQPGTPVPYGYPTTPPPGYPTPTQSPFH